MIKGVVIYTMLSSVLSGCAIGPCKTWEIGDRYQDSDVYGMFICKSLIENYHKDNIQGIYSKARQLLAGADKKYSECSIVEGSLIIYTRTDQVFLKIDCSR